MADGHRLRPESLADIIRAHRIARMARNSWTMACLENTLAGIGYHTLRDLLHAGDYDKAAAFHQLHSKER